MIAIDQGGGEGRASARAQYGQSAKITAKPLTPRFSHYWATLLYKSITSGLGERHLVAHPVGFAAQGQAPDLLTWRRLTK